MNETIWGYMVVPGDLGKRVTEFVEETALNDCCHTNYRLDDDGTWYEIDLGRPVGTLSSGELILWRTALWAAGDIEHRPTHTEAKDAVDADCYHQFALLVAERERGAW